MYSESWKDSLVKWIVGKLPRKMVYFAVVRARDMVDVWPTEEAVVILASDIVGRWEKSARSRMDEEGGVFRSSFSEIVDQLAIRQAQVKFKLCSGLLLSISGWTALVIYLCWIAFGG